MQFKRVDQIVCRRLCTGCGACVPRCPEGAVHLVDVQGQGIRPAVDSTRCRQCRECVTVCPGIAVSHELFNCQTLPELRLAWGPVLEVWEGYAADPEIRYKGSSGGVVTALALFCLEKERASGVLHLGADQEVPWQNMPVFSRKREELLAFSGSRYSPGAPCAGFDWIEKAEHGCVFIGKPCDVVALRKSQTINQALACNASLAISIFCAGTPATQGTFDLFQRLDVTPGQVEKIRYRGCGWPGTAVVKLKPPDGKQYHITYEESWGNILSKHVPLRCRLCPDGTGEFADISCGDPWYREIEPGKHGWSLVLVRTERGREILRKTIKEGFVRLERAESDVLPRSQKALLKRRRHLWGRLLVMRMLGVPIPRYTGFSLFRNWFRLPATEKLRSVAGTLKRLVERGWISPLKPIYPGKRIKKASETERPLSGANGFE